jgi:hypothetical protein
VGSAVTSHLPAALIDREQSGRRPLLDQRNSLTIRAGRRVSACKGSSGTPFTLRRATSRGPPTGASARRTMSPEASVDRDRPGVDPFRLHRLGHCRDAVYDMCPLRQAREQQPRSVGR